MRANSARGELMTSRQILEQQLELAVQVPQRTRRAHWGFLIGIGVPLIGIVAAVGPTLFFVGAVITHLPARDYYLGNGAPVAFL
jgi:hypothetical protein